ncbi:MAG: hypothetical protein IKJ13_02580 [Clostridia bacterium]|nr:hypothetical protein [Clostridia bacterium]
MMEKEKLKEPYLEAQTCITQILSNDVIQTSGDLFEEEPGSNSVGNGWT